MMAARARARLPARPPAKFTLLPSISHSRITIDSTPSRPRRRKKEEGKERKTKQPRINNRGIIRHVIRGTYAGAPLTSTTPSRAGPPPRRYRLVLRFPVYGSLSVVAGMARAKLERAAATVAATTHKAAHARVVCARLNRYSRC